MTTSHSAFSAAGLDLAIVLDRVGGDTELLREIASIFLDEYPCLLEQVRLAVADGNARELDRAAHALKGSVANFGSDQATAAAYALEVIGRTGQMQSAPAALARLEAELSRLRPALAAIMTGSAVATR